MVEGGEYSWDIKAFVAARGVEISDDQLKYWRDEGALPSWEIVAHPGGSGRTALYPRGTSEYVLALAKLLRRGDDLASATWRLWLDGQAVPAKWWRERLIEVAATWDKAVAYIGSHAFEGRDTLSDDVLDALEAHPRLYHPVLRSTRKLTGRIGFATLIMAFIRIATGQFKTFDDMRDRSDPAHADLVRVDRAIVRNGLGMSARHVTERGGPNPIPDHALDDGLAELSAGFAGGALAKRLAELSDAEIQAGALELAAIRKAGWLQFKAWEWSLGRHAFGIGHGARISRLYNAEERVRLLVLWLVCLRPRPGYSESARRFVERQGDAWRARHDSLSYKPCWTAAQP
jgi:hypothetical protein